MFSVNFAGTRTRIGEFVTRFGYKLKIASTRESASAETRAAEKIFWKKKKN